MKRFPFLSRYLVALAGVMLMYAIYATLVVPTMLGDGPKRKTKSNNILPLARDMFDPAKHFAEDRWERGQCKILRTKHGYVLFKDYFPKDDGTVDVKPVSFVLPTSDMGTNAGDAPIILQAPSAVLTFDRRMSMGGGFGKFQKGRLLGNIRISRLSKHLDSDQQFVVNTKNIFLTKAQIYTREAVDFHFGPHRGNGRDLMIALDQPKGPNNGFGQAKVKEIRLQQLDEMVIDNRPRLGSDAQFVPESHQASGDFESARFRVTCRGAFVYEVGRETATLNDDVQVNRLDGFADQLKCTRLKLFFDRIIKSAAAKNRADDKGSSSKIKIHRVLALGSPATIDMKSRQTFLQADSIEYDFQTATADMSGSHLILTREDFRFYGKSIKYTNTDDGSLGKAIAHGPGKIIRYQTERGVTNQSRIEFESTFQDKLTIQPHSGKKVISFYGESEIKLGDSSTLNADELHFWLWEIANSVPSGTATQRYRWVPSQLIAKGSVDIRSSQVIGTAQQLVANWQSQTVRDTNFQGRHNLGKRIVVAKPVVQELSLQTTGRQRDPQKQSKPIYFVGGRVDIDLPPHVDNVAKKQEKSPSISRFNKVVISENVTISNQPLNQNQTTPSSTRIVGDKVTVTPANEKPIQDPIKYRVEVTARQHATLTANGFKIQGNPIMYDQWGGRAWIQGQGQLNVSTTQQISTDSQSSFIASPASAAKTKPTTQTDIQINWDGGMVFDGRQIYFENEVVSNINRNNLNDRTTTKTVARAKAMTLVLEKPIDLTNSSQSTTTKANPKIEKLILVSTLGDNQAVFKSYWTDRQTNAQKPVVQINNQSIGSNGKTNSVQIVKVPSAILLAQTGDLSAPGPGTVQIWHTGNGTQSPFRSTSTDQRIANLTYTQVNFVRSLIGNSKKKQLEIQGNIRSVYAPVGSLQETVDPDSRQFFSSPNAVQMVCDKMDINQWQSQNRSKPHLELVCSGQTVVRGRLFKATGNRVRYDQSGDKVIIEGTAPNFAQLEHRKNLNQSPATATAEKLTYFLKSKTYQAENVKHGRATIQGKIGGGR